MLRSAHLFTMMPLPASRLATIADSMIWARFTLA
jgi:hypothetical protein